MKNRNKILINVMLTIFVWLIIYIIRYQYQLRNIDISLKLITIIGMLINIYCIVSYVLIERKITSPYTIFQMLSIPFYYGQLFCREIIGYDTNSMFDLRILVTEELIVEACFLVSYCQLALHLGVVISKLFHKNVKDEKYIEINKDIEYYALKMTGLIMLAISILPAFYILINDLIAAKSFRI